MLLHDTAPADEWRETRDGYLSCSARLSRVGVYQYDSSEVGRPGSGKVNVWRSNDEVFAPLAMTSFAYKPVTVLHPQDGVSADTWRQHAVGFVAGDMTRDGLFLRATVIVQDRAAIQSIRGGVRELSAGYTCELEFADAKTPGGYPVQASMRDIRGNHLALVQRGRAGPLCAAPNFQKDTSR